jgi:dihydrofolate reductase
MLISLVAAMDQNGVIGAEGALPWRLPDDMRRFREITWGKPVVMGRKTYESLPERFRPLPGRRNIVLTRQAGYAAPGCTRVHSVEAALEAAGDAPEVMVIGGAELYAQLLPRAGRIYLTLVDGAFAGDAYFPPLDWGAWRIVQREPHPPDTRHAHAFTFLILERVAEEAATDRREHG